MNMQKVAPEDFQRQIFRELKELEDQKTRGALELVQRKHKLMKGREQGCCKGWSRHGRLDSGPEPTTFSLAFDTDEAMSASSKMAKEADEAMSESFWTALAKEKGRDW